MKIMKTNDNRSVQINSVAFGYWRLSKFADGTLWIITPWLIFSFGGI